MPPAYRGARGELDDERELELLEQNAERAMILEDVTAGAAPVWATRALLPAEIAARVSFAAIDDGVQTAARSIARRLAADREQFLELVSLHLRTRSTPAQVVAELQRVLRAGMLVVPGVGRLTVAAERAYRAELERLALSGGARAVAEAIAQGVTGLPAPALSPFASTQIDQAAWRLAATPHLELLRALELEALRLPTPAAAGAVESLVDALLGVGRGLSPNVLELYGREAAQSADGLGRQAAVETGAAAGRRPARIYASELLDGRQCIPCGDVDGREYATLADARADYPTGIYRACEGGLRCRGTLVFVWPEEAVPELVQPGDRGPRPGGGGFVRP